MIAHNLVPWKCVVLILILSDKRYWIWSEICEPPTVQAHDHTLEVEGDHGRCFMHGLRIFRLD